MTWKAKYVTHHAMGEMSDLLIILQREISDKIVTKYINNNNDDDDDNNNNNNNNNNNFQRQVLKSPVLRFIFVPYHLLTGEILVIRRPKTNFVAHSYKTI